MFALSSIAKVEMGDNEDNKTTYTISIDDEWVVKATRCLKFMHPHRNAVFECPLGKGARIEWPTQMVNCPLVISYSTCTTP